VDRTPRSRVVYATALLIVIAAGLGSRVFGRALPAFVATYAGDTLYATMMFVGLGVLAPRWTTARLAGAAFAICCTIEVSQLYHAPWIDAIRRTLPGALVLGSGFLWSDLACYAAGVALGAGIETGLPRRLVSGRWTARPDRCDKLRAWDPSRRSSFLACPAPSTRPGASPDRRASPTGRWCSPHSRRVRRR
jgi:hypothetical protein